jgi:hypothetical protein
VNPGDHEPVTGSSGLQRRNHMLDKPTLRPVNRSSSTVGLRQRETTFEINRK